MRREVNCRNPVKWIDFWQKISQKTANEAARTHFYGLIQFNNGKVPELLMCPL